MKLRILKIDFLASELKNMKTDPFLDHLENNFDKNKLIEENYINEKRNKLYPKIQLKNIDGQPTIIAVKKGIKLLRKIFPIINNLKHIGDKEAVSDKDFYMYEEELGRNDEMVNYHFVTPWFPFYSGSYEDYIHFQTDIQDERFRKLGVGDLTRKMLIGCVYRMSKSIGYSVHQKFDIESDLVLPAPKKVDPATVSITGNFAINFFIPSFLGLGNNVFKNRGVVEQIIRK